MAKTIKIAPSLDEIEVGANYIKTEWNGGIRYEAEGLDRYKPEFLKFSFSAAIAGAGRRWQLEAVLNNYLNLEGKVV